MSCGFVEKTVVKVLKVIETLAEDIARKILENKRIQSTEITIKKTAVVSDIQYIIVLQSTWLMNLKVEDYMEHTASS